MMELLERVRSILNPYMEQLRVFIWQFTAEQVELARYGVLILIFVLTVFLGRSTVEKTKKSLFDAAKKNKDKIINSEKFDYAGKEAYLRMYGVQYMIGREVNPSEFLLVQFFFGLILGLSAASVNILALPVGAIIGYYLPNFLVAQSNKGDNEGMVTDIKKIYDTLRIQTKAGVFLTSALGECYLVVTEKRLKDALQELNGHINARGDIETGLEHFKSRFKSSHIDNFCVVIKQSTESGKTVQVLEDLASQITDLDEAINIRLESKVQLKQNMIQFMVFSTAVAVIGFGLASSMMSQLVDF